MRLQVYRSLTAPTAASAGRVSTCIRREAGAGAGARATSAGDEKLLIRRRYPAGGELRSIPPSVRSLSTCSFGVVGGGTSSSDLRPPCIFAATSARAGLQVARSQRRQSFSSTPWSANSRGGGEDSSSSLKPVEADYSYPELTRRAREISSRAPKSSKVTIGASSDANIDRASDAAGALLALTSSTALRSAFAQRTNQNTNNNIDNIEEDADGKTLPTSPLNQDTIEALHFAFLSVTSWLQSSISAAASETSTGEWKASQRQIDVALRQCIELTVRSADLDLPLSAPIYQTLAILVAKHSSLSCQPSIQIVEVANLQRVALFPHFNPPPESFFHIPCVALIRRGLIREAIELLDEMDAEFGITSVNVDTGLEMLSAVAQGLGLDGNSKAGIVFGAKNNANEKAGKAVMEMDPVDATELVFRLRGPLLRQLEDLAKEIRKGMDPGGLSDSALEGATNAELADLLESLSGEGDDSGNDIEGNLSEFFSDDEKLDEMFGDKEDEDDDDVSSLATVADIESLRDAVNTLGDGTSESSSQSSSLQQEKHQQTCIGYGEVYGHGLPPQLQDRFAREMVYIRRGSEWELPDLIDQISIMTGTREVLYSSEYERYLIHRIMEEEDDEDFEEEEGGGDNNNN